jgi:putative transposase
VNLCLCVLYARTATGPNPLVDRLAAEVAALGSRAPLTRACTAFPRGDLAADRNLPAAHGPWRAADLVKRDFPAQKMNTRWYGDGTGTKTGQGKLYLASVLDMASRRVLGFALGEHHDAALAYGALAMAVAVRGGPVPGVIMHTDRGSEYTAGAFRAACARLGACQSMGRPGSALDNAVIESWHSTLEFELRSVEHFATKAEARARVPAWIHDYNHNRRHSACQMMSPVDYERALAAGKAA